MTVSIIKRKASVPLSHQPHFRCWVAACGNCLSSLQTVADFWPFWPFSSTVSNTHSHKGIQFEHCSEIPFWVKSNQWMLGTEGQSLACVHMLFLDSLGYDHQSVSRSVHSHDPGSTALLFLGVLLITPHNVLSGTLLSITLIISHVHSELWNNH